MSVSGRRRRTQSVSVLVLLFCVVGLAGWPAAAELAEDKAALLDFMRKVRHGRPLNWSNATPVCSGWVGVTCDGQSRSVVRVRLPAVGLLGNIPPATLGRLTELQVLSLRSNRLSGHLPADMLSDLKMLRALYLQHNQLSGPLPTSLTRLVRLDLSFNNFSSSLPFALSGLRRLSQLDLRNNSFSGPIPNLDLPGLKALNLSYNRLNGSIPRALSRFGASAFAGNAGLCGEPVRDCEPFFHAPAPAPTAPVQRPRKKKKKTLSNGALAAVIVGAAALVFLLFVVLMLVCAKRRRDAAVENQAKDAAVSAAAVPKEDYPQSSSQEGGAEKNKLVFMEGSSYSFDLEDLLRASAEVLGKGSVGTSYKAVLEDGTTVVVKRLKDVVASRKDFEQQMNLVGTLRHSNLLPLRAFYYSKDEKLLVFDYLPTGSLSAMLHGGRASGRNPLYWEARTRIALGAAQGIAQLHADPRLVHGNIKSSNILLTSTLEAVVADFGLTQVFGAQAAASRAATGYRSPEAASGGRLTQKGDVYSFGVLLLELLTGKSPSAASLGDEGAVDLPRWVQSVVREEWTAEVFDAELVRSHNSIEEDMVQLLQIAMACVASGPDQRPSMADVASMIQEMRHSASQQESNNNGHDNNGGGNNGGKNSSQEASSSAAAAVTF